MVASDKTIARVIGWFHEAADAARSHPNRRGCLLELGADDGDDVLVSTDLHGQRLHFRRLQQIAAMDTNPGRHLVMQEVCHGGPDYPGGGCMSHLLLEDMARLQIEYPSRFHYLLSNHEVAEMMDFPITKGSRMLNLDFRRGLQQFYGDGSEDVRDAAVRFLWNCPLAIRLANRVFVSHSCPASVDEMGFDMGVLGRELESPDLAAGGAAFRLVWGRDFREANAEAFARLVDAEVLVHGHEPCPSGFQTPNRFQVILDSGCPLGHCLTIPLQGAISQSDLVARLQALFSEEAA